MALVYNRWWATDYAFDPVDIEFGPLVWPLGGIAPAGWLDETFGAHTVWNSQKFVLPSGATHTLFGTTSVEGVPEIKPVGIYQGDVPTGALVYHWRRTLEPGSIAAGSSGAPMVSHYDRTIDLAGYGIIATYGTPQVELKLRYVYPNYIPPGSVGSHQVGRHQDVLPTGFDAALYGTAWVHDLTQWVYPAGVPQTLWGDAWVSRSPRTLEPVGFPSTIETFPSTRWGIPTLYNLRQYVYQSFAPGTEDGGVFGSYIHMLVENRNRPMTPLGWRSSRVSNVALIENNADPAYPPTIGAESWGRPMVAQAIRYVTTQGWEEFYAHPLGTALHNAARVIAPAGWDSQSFGLAAHSNPPQDIRFVGRINDTEVGLAFVAPRIRTITVPLGIDGYPIPDPKVENAIRYLSPSGMVLPFTFGSHHVEERFTIFYPAGFHAYRAGDNHYVFNVNREVAPYAYDQAEIGLHTIDLFTRYVVPLGIGEDAIPRPRIADSRQYINGNGNDQLRVGAGTQVTKIPPDPPPAQTVYQAGFQWSVYGSAEVRRNQIDCAGEVQTRWGDAEVRLLGAIVSSIDPLVPMFGTPSVRGPRWLYVSSENVEGMEPPEFEKQRLNPHTIWATFAATQQAIVNNGGMWELVDQHLDVLDTGERPFFGRPAVTNYSRGITASGASFGGIGQPSIESTIRTIRPDGIRSLRMGIPRLPGLQYIDFLLGTGMSGVVIGDHAVSLQDRAIAVPSLEMPGETGQYGIAEVDYFHRYRTPTGWDSVLWGQPSPLDDRSSPGLRVHFFEPMVPQGYVATLWGDTFVSHRIRNVYPQAWVAFDMSSTPGMFRERMRVRHGSRRVAPPSVASNGAYGVTTVWQGTRRLYPDSIWMGHVVPAPDIRYQSIIALGGHGFDSSIFGDVQRWEAGKIKPQGEEYTTFGNVRTNRVMYANGVAPAGFGAHVVGPGANPGGWDATLFGEHVLVYADGNEFLCGRKAHALVLGNIAPGAIGAHVVTGRNGVAPTGFDELLIGSANVLRALGPSGWDALDMSAYYAGEDYFAEDYHDPAYAVTVSRP